MTQLVIWQTKEEKKGQDSGKMALSCAVSQYDGDVDTGRCKWRALKA